MIVDSRAGREQEAIGAVTDDAARCLLLIGTPDEIVERLDDLGARGCTSVSVLSTKGFAETVENLTRIGRGAHLQADGRQSQEQPETGEQQNGEADRQPVEVERPYRADLHGFAQHRPHRARAHVRAEDEDGEVLWHYVRIDGNDYSGCGRSGVSSHSPASG